MLKGRLALVAVAVCIAVQLLAMQPAAATGVISVTPDSNLFEGQTVTVTGTGWPADALIIMTECLPGIGCFGDRFGTDAEGTFTVPFVVRDVFGTNARCSTSADPCFIVASDRDSSSPPVPLSFSGERPGPDAQIRNRATGVLTGDNVYNLDALGQTRNPRPIAAGTKWTFALRIENDGDQTDAFTVTGPGGASPIGVQYFFGFYDITPYVTGSGFTFPDLEPGAAFIFAIRFAPDTDALPGATRNALLSFGSQQHPSAKDAVKVGVVVATT